MAVFLSTIVNKIDRKGRVSVPAPYRARIASFVAFPSLKLPAIEACDMARMEEMSARRERLDPNSEDYQNYSVMFADSHELPFDPEGRVILPEHLCRHAGITESVAFVGQGQTFQLWDPERFREHQEALRERARQRGATMPPPVAAEGKP